MVSAAVTREGHCSERESTQGGVVVGGPLQCWEEGGCVCRLRRPALLTKLLTSRGMERGRSEAPCAVGGSHAVAGVPALCTADSRLAPPP